MTILEEALVVVKDRQATYGPPLEHWGMTIRLINARFGTTFRAEDWGIFMILDKIARQAHTPKRDNMVDVAGYANGVQTCLEARSVYRYVWEDCHETGKTVVSETEPVQGESVDAVGGSNRRGGEGFLVE